MSITAILLVDPLLPFHGIAISCYLLLLELQAIPLAILVQWTSSPANERLAKLIPLKLTLALTLLIKPL